MRIGKSALFHQTVPLDNTTKRSCCIYYVIGCFVVIASMTMFFAIIVTFVKM